MTDENLHQQIMNGFATIKLLNNRDETQLFVENPSVNLEFELWENFGSNTPYRTTFPISHPLYDESNLPVVLITKDEHEEWKEKIADLNAPFKIKTYGYKKYTRRFNNSSRIRELIKESKIILADGRLGHVLSRSLSELISKKKTPVLIDLNDEDKILENIQKELHGSPALLPKDKKFAAPVGYMDWEAHKIADNSLDVFKAIFEKVGKDNVAKVGLRIPGIPGVPVYTADISGIF